MTSNDSTAATTTTPSTSAGVVGAGAANWLWRITHSGLAMTGVGIVCLVLLLSSQDAVREPAEEQLLDYLQSRQETRLIETQTLPAEPTAAERATVAMLSDLPEHQAVLTRWISRQYRVAPEPLAVLVAEAHDIGERIEQGVHVAAGRGCLASTSCHSQTSCDFHRPSSGSITG